MRCVSCINRIIFDVQACDAVLASKDAVINEMVAELKFKDEEYQVAIEQQAKDFNDLCTIMARQVRSSCFPSIVGVFNRWCSLMFLLHCCQKRNEKKCPD